MSRHTIRHGAVIKCSARIHPEAGGESKPCQERFTTYSVVRLARTQARNAGWGRARAWHASGNREDGVDRIDCCPEHMKIAIYNKDHRKDLMAADKLAREAEKQKKAAAWAETKRVWAEKRAQKAADKERRAREKAARAAKDAAKAQDEAARAKARIEAEKPPQPDPSSRRSKAKANKAASQAEAKQLASGSARGRRQTTLPAEES